MTSRTFRFVLFMIGTTVGCGGSQSKSGAPGSATVSTEAPLDLVAEVEMRDPAGVVDRVGAEMGMTGSLYARLIEDTKDVELKELAACIDPHGTVAFVVVGTLDQPHFMIGVHLRDAAKMKTFAQRDIAAGKSQNITAPPIGGLAWSTKTSTLVLVDDLLLIGDREAKVESRGGYLARRALAKQPDHDVVGRVAIGPMVASGQGAARKAWLHSLSGSQASTGFARAMRPIVSRTIDAMGDVGDLTFSMDWGSGNYVADVRVAARGKLAQFLGSYPSASVSSLLTLPKGEAMIVRFPQALGKIFAAALADEGERSADDDAKDELTAAIRTLGSALGREVAIVYRPAKPKPAKPVAAKGSKDSKESKEEPVEIDVLARLELADPPGARAAVRKIVELTTSSDSKKAAAKDAMRIAPYKRYGSEGEEITGKAKDGGAVSMIWTQRATYLYLEMALDRPPALLDDALDPSGKLFLRTDPKAKAAIERFPAEGLMFAYYGESAYEEFPEGPRWLWVAADAQGLHSQMGVGLSYYRPTLEKWISDSP